MTTPMATAIRAVHELDLQTHAYQEDQDPQRLAVARYHAARLLLAVDAEAMARGLDDERQRATARAWATIRVRNVSAVGSGKKVARNGRRRQQMARLKP